MRDHGESDSKIDMRVLHLIPSLVGGGAERQLAVLANELARQGVETHVGFVHGGPNLRRIDASRVHIHELGANGNHDPLILWHLLRLVRRIRPRIVQTWLLQMDVLGGIVARLCAIPHVLAERSSAQMYSRTWKYRLRDFIGSRATLIAANSQGGADYWLTRAAGVRAVVIRNGTIIDDADEPTQADTDFNPPPGLRLVIVAGRLSAEKNLERLIVSMDRVLAARADCMLVVFGDGPLRSTLSSSIARMKTADRIQLVGYTSHLSSWMMRAALCVSVSKFEGNPNVVVEAMTLGCPLMVSDIPQHREILDASTAIFCDTESTEDIAAKIGLALDDRQGARARAHAAQLRAAPWTVAATASAYVELYRELLAAT